MASFTMTASIFGCPAVTKRSAVAAQRRLLVVSAAKAEGEKVSYDNNDSNGRRNLMFAVAAAAVFSVAGMAVADEPKPGTSEAKKKYAPFKVDKELTIPPSSRGKKNNLQSMKMKGN
ncbi:hypothetical protein JHK87_027291 [Glycine soja]|nr:hypothetical protein JHK87_027291 [Glycine soja]